MTLFAVVAAAVLLPSCDRAPTTAPLAAPSSVPAPVPSSRAKHEVRACALRVSFPGEASCTDRTETAPIGSIESHVCRCTTDTRPVLVYVAGCEDYPDEYVRRVNDPRSLLDASLQGEINSSRGKMVEAKDVSLGSLPGREATIDVNDAVMITRVYIEGRRIYHIGVVGPAEAVREKATALFASIELGNASGAPRTPPDSKLGGR